MKTSELLRTAVALLLAAVILFAVGSAVVAAISRNVDARSTVPSASPSAQNQPKKEYRYYGSTYYEGVITSVYYYPEGDGDHNGPVTHVKFDHNDNLDIWFCGDQRQKIRPGFWKRRVTLTDELESPRISNWSIR